MAEPVLKWALELLANGTDFAPSRDYRPTFHRLVDLGWAKWCGYGLGGEAFRITPAGLAVLSNEASDL